ncbi:uncharacterized protein K460DRAFT_403245 [Cucurbitaria berberidis CBS 394.84]|uniref:Uncharacterized protein n=1 Tax=Cucurbitaria berberidis CBS 394.84 TaxID=1168544 RepID=A0A9P4LB16_9PLEO|nr:uncharacterized protein K460DRAFT_403245 [Cucurbitaria berberidis CBS 394.84]KAF1847927.1 hypothetical protein K460DRAFT_403245 [Cucurbitaria berberidis CBS 394.84]
MVPLSQQKQVKKDSVSPALCPSFEDTVYAAIPRALSLVQTYAKPFASSKEAEQYVEGVLEWRGLHYGFVANAPISFQSRVRNRIHYEVARRAVDAGILLIDRSLQQQIPTQRNYQMPAVDSKETRENIKQLKALIKEWPPSFGSLRSARNYARSICKKSNLRFTLHRGVKPSKIRNFVLNAIIRDAHEAGFFQFGTHPGGHGLHSETKIQHRAMESRERKVNSPSSVHSGSSATLTVDDSFQVPSTPTLLAKRKTEKDLDDAGEKAFNTIDIRAEILAARFELAERMMSRLGLDLTDRNTPDLEGPMAPQAEQNDPEVGFTSGGENSAFKASSA